LGYSTVKKEIILCGKEREKRENRDKREEIRDKRE
jgi:hypothetical protein